MGGSLYMFGGATLHMYRSGKAEEGGALIFNFSKDDCSMPFNLMLHEKFHEC